MDGIYHEENKQPGLSLGITRAMTLFNEYRKSVIIIDNGCVDLCMSLLI